MLYHKRTKSVIKWVWGFFALLIAVSMIFAYSGGAGVFSGAPAQQQVAPTAQDEVSGIEMSGDAEVTLPPTAEIESEPSAPFEISI